MKTINIIACLFLIVVQTTNLIAQEESAEVKKQKHEISLSAGVGLSTLRINTDVGVSNNKVAPNFALTYRYYISNKFSIGTGAEFAFYNSELDIKDFSSQYSTIDSEGQSFTFKAKHNNYKETLKSTFVNIPLNLQFETQISEGDKFYMQLGVKVGLPMSAKSDVNIGYMNTSGLYNFQSGEVQLENIPSEGFGKFDDVKANNTIKFNTAFIFTSEIGFKWKVASNSLYTGVYFDYGLNNIAKESDKNIVTYNWENPTEFTYNSAIESSHTINDVTNKIVNKVLPMAVGIKLRFSLNFFDK